MIADLTSAVAEYRGLASFTAEIAGALNRAPSLRAAVHGCASALVSHLGAAFARIWTLNDRTNVLELQASAGQYTHLDGPHGRVPVGKLKIGLIAQERQPHLTNSLIGDPRISDQEWVRREGMVAFAGYPLLVADRVVGVMALFSRQPLSHATLNALAMVADVVAYGIEHWRTVEALRASEERFALAVQGTAEGIWDWNVLTNELYYSPRFNELLGYTGPALEGSFAGWVSLLHPDDRDRTQDALRRHLEQRERFQLDYRLRTCSGHYRWFQARGQAQWDASGQPVRMLGSVWDITARKCSEERLATIHRVTQLLAEATDLTLVMPRILQAVCEKFNWKVGELWVRGASDDVLRLAAFSYLPNQSVAQFEQDSRAREFPRGVGLPGRTWATGQPEWVEDLAGDVNFLRASAAAQANIESGVSFPIRIHGEVRAVMVFFNSHHLRTDDELLNTLSDISHQISRSIELQQQQEAVRVHRQELAIARRIQQHTYPKVMPTLEGLELAGASEPATETGGDYFDFIPLASEHLLVGIGDVSGHGLGPALVLAGARAYVRVLAQLDLTIDRIINLVNARLAEDTNEEFMTLFLGVINPFNRSLIYYNAGHCPGLIVGPDGEVRATLPPSDQPLGLDLPHKYQQSSVVQLLPGDLLFLYSDGIFETPAQDGAPFGMDRALEIVRAARHLPPAAIITTLFGAVRDAAQTAPRDDLTAVVIKVADQAAASRQEPPPPHDPPAG